MCRECTVRVYMTVRANRALRSMMPDLLVPSIIITSKKEICSLQMKTEKLCELTKLKEPSELK